jgi:hypothetical protein
VSIIPSDNDFVDEMLKAVEAGVELEEYLGARDAGASATEISLIHQGNLSIPTYTAPRRAGATHQETIEAFNAGMDLLDYADGRSAGATHSELFSGGMMCSPMLLRSYVALRATGIDHASSGRLTDLRISWDLYVEAAQAGASFNEILNAHAKRVDLHLYAIGCASSCLADHAAVLAWGRRVLPNGRQEDYDSPC